MDRFSEQLIKKESTGKDMFIRGLFLAAAMLIFGLVFFFYPSPLILVVLFAGEVWALVWLIQGTMVEYEYIVTNDDLDIDKIIGKRKRKRLITISLRTVKEIEPYASGSEISADVTVMAHDETGEDLYCLKCDSADYGELALIFNPDMRTVKNIVGGLAPAARIKYSEKYGFNEAAEDAAETDDPSADTDIAEKAGEETAE